MTDENMAVGMDDEGVDWSDMTPHGNPMTQYPEGAKVIPSYPEMPDLPEARFSLNMAPDKPPMVTVRAQTATEMTAALNELEAGGVYANIAAAYASLRAQGTIGAGMGPVTPVTPQAPPPGLPPTGPPQTPQTPPPFGPNVSAPQAPNYQGPPQQQWQQAAPQSGGWGGNAGSGGQQRSNEKPRPAGWAMVDVPFNDKDRFKALRAQGTETGNYLRGKIQWGGKGVYWLDPSIAAWIGQQGFPVMQ